MDKIKGAEEIGEISLRLRNDKKIIVTTNGSFDILHYAHINLLEKAKQEGDVLIVLLNGDDKRFKGESRPIIPQDERAGMLAALGCVDFVVIFDEDKPLSLLEKIKPNEHIKGGSFIPERIKEEKDLLKKWGGEFKSFELEEGFSTTNIIEKVLEKNDFKGVKI